MSVSSKQPLPFSKFHLLALLWSELKRTFSTEHFIVCMYTFFTSLLVKYAVLLRILSWHAYFVLRNYRYINRLLLSLYMNDQMVKWSRIRHGSECWAFNFDTFSRIWIENKCFCPRIVGISKVNSTNKNTSISLSYANAMHKLRNIRENRVSGKGSKRLLISCRKLCTVFGNRVRNRRLLECFAYKSSISR